ncbi:GNAT family N-acetyltransferase [uncultured Bacteroides sp.]|uniref:GNAT family N-acetyltransferase n=1 Tax=uncultured Bacteroides sp. TaxID=162156 RepID=UPI002AA77D73|nr:GNAT family N-acetyltransferase [uncultured Bacteroides sp.]
MLKRQIKELWQLCFNESKSFTELYFTYRYNNDVNIYIQSGEAVISALQMLPYPMTFCGNEIQTSYISGACTHPDYQRRGVMRELLSQAFARMQSQGILFSTIIPANNQLFNYYSKSGYATVFNYLEEEKLLADVATNNKGLKIDTHTTYREDIYNYFLLKMEERSCCIQHTANDFNVILADLRLESGNVFVASHGKTICGLAICYPDNQTLRVGELLADNDEVEKELLHSACKQWSCDKISITRPANSKTKAERLGMIRIIDAKKVLQLFAAAFPQAEMNIELTDDTLAANNGYYYVNNGKCMKSEDRLPGVHQRINVEELALTIFDQLHPYMSLMLN